MYMYRFVCMSVRCICILSRMIDQYREQRVVRLKSSNITNCTSRNRNNEKKQKQVCEINWSKE